MSSFVPRASAPTLSEPDPAKHVKYTLGMVLGVDDFTQEFAYLSGRDQWAARDLIGYGTVSGLRVTVEPEDGRPQVLVTPGSAVNPRGRLIRVNPSQCADLGLWLGAHGQEVSDSLGVVQSTQALLRLYVVLCYRECATDLVPIPGEPCRSQDDAMAPSRLADDFRLELRLAPPDQTEEDALRDFIDWLGQVQITDEAGTFTTLEELEAAVRDASHLYSSPVSAPPSSPLSSPVDYMYGSPPSGLRIHPAMAFEYLRAVSRIWVTELRPGWQARRHDAALAGAQTANDEECVLLAELSVPVARAGLTARWEMKEGAPVEVHEERRPYLLHLRMLQEIILNGRRAAGGSGNEGSAIGPSFTVVSETNYGQLPKAGTRFDYARADHTHGTPPPPTLVGDASGPVGDTHVTAIRGVGVDSATPSGGQVLTFDANLGRWKPATPPPVPQGSGSPDAVTHPHGLPAYRVVAAGVVSGKADGGAKTYNKLRALKASEGVFVLTFDGYRKPQPDSDNPDRAFQYIVKALLVAGGDSTKLNAPAVLFNSFADDSFSLLVTDGGKPVAADQLAGLQLMIEVSQFDLTLVKNLKELKEVKEKEKETGKEFKEKEKEKETGKETKEKETPKETKEKDTKETKEKDKEDSKDNKEAKENKEDNDKGIHKELVAIKEKDKDKEKDTKEKDKEKDKEKETKEKEKDTKEKEAEKLTDKGADKLAKESKEKDTKETKEKDTKETKEKDTKETKEKDAEKLTDKVADKLAKEADKLAKETKEKDTKETKEKDTKESKDTKDTKDTKETKEKDTKETKEKDTKETKEKDTKETKDTKDSKEKELTKDNKEAKENKEDQDGKISSKEVASLKEKDLDNIAAPDVLSALSGSAVAPGDDGASAVLLADGADETLPEGRAFIRGEERPAVGRKALELADEPVEKSVEKPVDKSAESSDQPGAAG